MRGESRAYLNAITLNIRSIGIDCGGHESEIIFTLHVMNTNAPTQKINYRYKPSKSCTYFQWPGNAVYKNKALEERE